MNRQVVVIGSDHAGYDTKVTLNDALLENGYAVIDVGCDSTDSVDYPVFANAVAVELIKNINALGILICGTGIGMSMVANKLPAIRAAVCHSIDLARLSKQHNDANILCLGARIRSELENINIMLEWLNTEFEGGRHLKRIQMF
jgi:ribose 5-phosphate isomerase B